MNPDYQRPTSLAEALALLTAEGPPATLMAGGTDLLVRMKKKVVRPAWLVDITAIPGLSEIRQNGSGVTLGAAVTHTDAARSEIIRRRYSALSDASSQIAAWQVRKRVGTRGGVFQPNDESRFPLMISVDGRDHRFCGGKEMPLSDGMEVCFIVPAVGG